MRKNANEKIIGRTAGRLRRRLRRLEPAAITGVMSRDVTNFLTYWKATTFSSISIEPLKAALAVRFGFSHPQHDAVKLADQRSLATELRDLCAPHRVNWHDLPPPAEAPIVPLGPDDAMAAFIRRYHELRPEQAHQA